jgi:hypothetical protein
VRAGFDDRIDLRLILVEVVSLPVERIVRQAIGVWPGLGKIGEPIKAMDGRKPAQSHFRLGAVIGQVQPVAQKIEPRLHMLTHRRSTSV